jgi:hypothetical protein
MTTPNATPNGSQHGGSTVAGLAREVEQLQRRLAGLAHLPGRVDRLAGTVTELADTVAGGKPSGPSQVAPSWLDIEAVDMVAATDILTRLAGWISGVYLRYSDARHLPECWLWHPDVVEELLWLHAAWIAAYEPEAPPTAVGDWHDRQRPGVVARVRQCAGMCSLDAHRDGGEAHVGAPAAPTPDAVPAIAEWWTTSRDQPAPAPTDEQITATREAWKAGTRR